MENLIVKNVDVFGDEIIAAQDKDGIIWAGVRWICDGIGLSERQGKSERKKIKEDIVLSKGGRNFVLPTNGGNQEVLCLQLDYIPLWLAKISITPNMKANNPELVEKLVKYQLKAKDVLAAAFLSETYSDVFNGSHSESANGQAQSTSKLNILNFHNTSVITTAEISKHYKVPCQNILSTFYRYKEYFDKNVHYFLLEAGEEIEFRKINRLSIATKLYLWTRKGSLMFTKIINNETSWKNYKRILDILFQKTHENKELDEPQKIESNDAIRPGCGKLKAQDNWYLRNAYKIERICKALDINVKEFNHLVITKIQEKYDMTFIGELYKSKNGNTPEFALDVINCFPELSEIADDMLEEFMLSIVDKFSLLKNMYN